jgi:ribosome-associated protein
MNTEALGLLKVISFLALEKKAIDLQAIDISGIDHITDCFLIATGFNDVHVVAIVEFIERQTKGTVYKALRREGIKQGSAWACLDFGNLILHVMTRDKRNYYNLESLWSDAPRIDIASLVEDINIKDLGMEDEETEEYE